MSQQTITSMRQTLYLLARVTVSALAGMSVKGDQDAYRFDAPIPSGDDAPR